MWLLIPWSALALWVMFGRRQRSWVPFLKLWDAPEELRKPRERRFQAPPLGAVLALLAALAGILAGARPVKVAPGTMRLVIVIDRGASMSAIDDGLPRFARCAQQLAADLSGDGPVELINIPTGTSVISDRKNWINFARAGKRSAMDTSAVVRATVASLAQRAGPVIVVSDCDLGEWLPDVIRVGPTRGVRNAGIIAFAAERGQAMVRVRSTFDGRAVVRFAVEGREASVNVELHSGRSSDVFVDLPLSSPMEARLEVADDFDGDNVAYLVKRSGWPAVEAQAAVSDELSRMLETYRRHRPAELGAVRVGLVNPQQVQGDGPMVILPALSPVQGEVEALRTVSHAITDGVEFGTIGPNAAVAAGGPGEGWDVVLRQGTRSLLAVRESREQGRRVWVGFDSRAFARTEQFVVFWTKLLDWVGRGDDRFEADSLSQAASREQRLLPKELASDIDPGGWAGVFQTGVGPVARNALPVQFQVSDDSWRARIASLKATRGALDLSPWVAAVGGLLILGAAMAWEKRRTPVPVSPNQFREMQAEIDARVETTLEADGHLHRHKIDGHSK